MAQRANSCPAAALRARMLASGMQPPDDLRPGALHRFPGIGKGPTNRAGWCWLSADGHGGAFGCFASSLSRTWRVKHNSPRSPQAQAALSRQIKEAKSQARQALRNQQDEA